MILKGETRNAHRVTVRDTSMNVATRRPRICMGNKETGYEEGRWLELVQKRVQWRVLVSAVLNLATGSVACY
jgi:hypothetical protein